MGRAQAVPPRRAQRHDRDHRPGDDSAEPRVDVLRTRSVVDAGRGPGTARLDKLVIPLSRVYVVAFALLALALLYGFLRHSRPGRALRAVVEDFEIAAIQGIRSRIYYPLGFGLGVGLAAVAGALMAPLFSVSPFVGATPLLKAFIVVILGGLGSIPGAAVAGLALGLAESYGSLLFESSTADMLIFAIVIVMLVVRPKGLLGRGEA